MKQSTVGRKASESITESTVKSCNLFQLAVSGLDHDVNCMLTFGGSHTVLTQCAPLIVAMHLITLNKGKIITSHNKGTRKYIS